MSFKGTSFIFDGIPSTEYGINSCRIVAGVSQSSGIINSGFTVISDTIGNSDREILYGATNNTPLEFDLVAYSETELDRYDIASISGWLCGHKTYKILSVVQDDMDLFRYKCLMGSFENIEIGGRIFGFKVHVRCDSPYAYMPPVVQTIVSTSTSLPSNFIYNNRSNVNDYYKPESIQIELGALSNFELSNNTTGESFTLTFNEEGSQINGMNLTITILPNGVMYYSETSPTFNIYKYSNKKFPRFTRGNNDISIIGNCTVTITSEFPMNIGY